MAFHAAPALVLRPGDKQRLEKILSSSNVDPTLLRRARVLSLAVEGMPNYKIALEAGCAMNTVKAWRARYEREGLDAMDDRGWLADL